MAVSYKRLWKLLVDKEMSKSDLRKKAEIAPNTMTKLRRDEEVSLTILSKICKTLHADFGDIVEYVPDAEIWDLYNENRELLGKDHIRGEQLPIDGYHLVVHVWIRNSNGQYLISQRSANRPTHPLMWECVSGSVVKGEDSLSGVIREAKEEVGIDLMPENGQAVIWKVGGYMKEKEHQSIEWKESWQDEYLKWICGYANAYGGTIYIGTDDDGNVVGIDNARDLLERIPNKITDTMGIIVDVNLLYKGELEYLQIIVDKYPSLISFHGKYYYRSGSTMREITGKELERALLKTQGRTWDGVPLSKLSVSDLKQDAIQLFKDKAVKRGRLTKEEVSVEDTILMDNLHLIDEDGYLIRAAMLAFYKDPEKWVTGSYIKIGYFGKSDSDLVYQDEVHGPLIEQVDKTVDLVYTKYMKALIDYEGVQRIEQFMFHKDAFREILLNAIVHKDYSSCNPIQISVYKDKIYIWNDGEMPPNLDSTDKLFMKHSSKPYNPKLANIFFKSGMIEAWGRGFEKIREACALYDGPLPEYEINEAGIMVLCKACDRYLRLLRDDGQHPEHHPNQNGQDVNKLIIDFCKDPKSVQEIMDEFDFDSRTSFRRKYLTPMLKNGVLKMTIPEKPSSKNQKYFS